ncbi:MAG: hypothetical protein IJV43_00625 [Oscillospiraceae bacterium]|nr:hypothetical protein [Oscillospiraceae bacterium]
MDQEKTTDAVETETLPLDGEPTALDELAAAKQAQLEFAMRDLDEFLARHAGVDVEKLMRNAKFLRFCGSRMGREPLATLYDDFTALVSEAGAAAVARLQSRSMRSTGGGAAAGGTLSPAQKYVLDAWNAEHPEMAMTAREFLGR